MAADLTDGCTRPPPFPLPESLPPALVFWGLIYILGVGSLSCQFSETVADIDAMEKQVLTNMGKAQRQKK